MTLLHLTVTKKWFDMISSGEKTEEYRDIKSHWIQRLTWHEFHKCDEKDLAFCMIDQQVFRKDLDAVHFKNGYRPDSRSVTVELTRIHIGTARPEWGAIGTKFILQLGKIIS